LAGLRRRFWVEAFIAVAAALALVLTLSRPEWIEEVFGVEPDAGSGWAEWLITAGLFAAALGSSVLGALEWRRPRTVAA
jgi:hypothetical protein